jgi:antitoxin component YwqK of YwqJK toxin-antitoxin module
MNSFKIHFIFSLIILFSTTLFLSCSEEEVPKSSLVVKDNLLYQEGSDVPFTGREKALVEDKIIEYEVKDGLKHGEFKIYSEEGMIQMKGQIDSNRNVGKWQYFYPNGEIESEGNFNYDRPDGKWIWKYPDGRIKEEGNYENGERVGIWVEFDHSGEVMSEYNYDLDSIKTDSLTK